MMFAYWGDMPGIDKSSPTLTLLNSAPGTLTAASRRDHEPSHSVRISRVYINQIAPSSQYLRHKVINYIL